MSRHMFPLPAVRIIIAAVYVSIPAAADHEALPYGNLEYMTGAAPGTPAVPVWPRAGTPCRAVGWTVSPEPAAGGGVCLQGTAAGEEFSLAGEGEGNAVVSLHLRADAATQATIRFSHFYRLARRDSTWTIDLTETWKRFEFTPNDGFYGPVELAVAPMGDVAIYAADFSIRCSKPPRTDLIEDTTPIPHQPVTLTGLQACVGNTAGKSGSLELTLQVPPDTEPVVPYVSSGIPFPRGEVCDRRCLRLETPAGTAVPAQFDVLSRWHGDNSVQAVLITLPVSAAPTVRLRWAPQPAATAKAMPTFPAKTLPALQPVVVTLDGDTAAGGNPEWTVTERTGPLCTVTCRRQRFGPVLVEMRVTTFANTSRCLVDCCFINEGERVAVRALGLQVDAAVTLRDAAENELVLMPDGRTVWGWPREIGAVVLSQGLARTMSLALDPNGLTTLPRYSTASMPLLTAPADWYCSTGVFGLLMPPDARRFPIFEKTLGSLETLGRFSWAYKERQRAYGWFNFGDAPGAGGWSNLETMADHQIFMHWFRTLSREHFDNARLAAEHYRDVDIDHRYGYCHTHCNNHTMSGEHWSHAWIQGLRDLYFLTGDGRALAVLHEVGERLLSKEPGFETGRDWTRPIDNLVDIYQASGDARYLEAVLAHLKVLGARQDPDTGVCGAENGAWYHHRYEAGSAFTWYGCLAMAKLHRNVGGAELRRIFLQELDLSLDVEKKGRAAYIYLPDESVTPDERAQVIGRYALGRGSVLFPALGYAYRITGNEKYLRIGMDALAHCLLNQRRASDHSATSFITAFLREARAAGWGPEQEAEAFERARKFSWEKHPRQLVNGGFEQDAFAGWSVKKVPGQDFYRDPVVNVSYHLDRDVTFAGARALRIHSDKFIQQTTVTSRVALVPRRRWRVSVWYRATETMTPSAFYTLANYEGLAGAKGSLAPTGKERGEWRELAGDFVSLGKMVLGICLRNSRGTGDVWFDEVALEDQGALGLLLTENGIGRQGRELAADLYHRTGGSYLASEPMRGDLETDGPIPFTAGALTDGDHDTRCEGRPCTYAYWERREHGELRFDVNTRSRIDRVAVYARCDPARRTGVSKIELLPADGTEPIAVIGAARHGWNTFTDLALDTRQIRLRLHPIENGKIIMVTEIEIWGQPQAE